MSTIPFSRPPSSISLLHAHFSTRIDVSLAVFDPDEGSITISQFKATDAQSAVNCLAHLNVCKTYLCISGRNSESEHSIAIPRLLNEMNIDITDIKHQTIQQQSIDPLFQKLKLICAKQFHSLLQKVCERNPSASSAAYALIELEDLVSLVDSQVNVFGDEQRVRMDFRHYVAESLLYVDVAAQKALNLFPGPFDRMRSESLFGLLNQCKTPMGSELLKQRIAQPLRDVSEINRRLDLVECFYTDELMMREVLLQHLKYIMNLPKFITQMTKFLGKSTRPSVRNNLTLKNIYSIHNIICQLPHLIECLDRHEGKHKQVLNSEIIIPLCKLTRQFKNFSKLVMAAIDDSQEVEFDFVVNEEAVPAIREINKEIRKCKQQFEYLRQNAAKDLRLDESKVKAAVNERTAEKLKCFRVASKDANALHRSQYSQIDTKKDGVRFTSPEIRKIAIRLKELEEQYQTEAKETIIQIYNVACTYLPGLRSLSAMIGLIDCTVTLANVSKNAVIAYTRPMIECSESGIIELRKSRHPCLEAQTGMSFIDNDVSLIKGKSNVQIITGPNMAGKSTYIRHIGTVVVMAQMGCFVPCEYARISVCDKILARVSATDENLKGMSTFMVEMVEADSILKAATENSLLIIDELGRGTSTFDGFGLAYAMCEYIAQQIRCHALFASHFHEITTLAESAHLRFSHSNDAQNEENDASSTIVNMHAVAETSGDQVVMLYKIADGAAQQSFGIHVAKMVKFPPEVIQDAQAKVEELESSSGRVIISLDEDHYSQKNKFDADCEAKMDAMTETQGESAIKKLELLLHQTREHIEKGNIPLSQEVQESIIRALE